ncbi:MAG: sulfotransferase [Alphaproteobacteria bacterium]|nr:sulfotransferase [Alphaproteobacteria bacterium]
MTDPAAPPAPPRRLPPGAAERAIAAALTDPRLIDAALALRENRIPDAERLLRAHLKVDPIDVAAIRMLAEVAARIGRFRDSETLLRRALELDPEFGAARANLATVLYRMNRSEEAISELDFLIGEDPDNPGHANLKAAALGKIGEFEEAIALYEEVLRAEPRQPRVWMSYGHMLKTLGRTDAGVTAYRKAIEIAPQFGEAWWSLANLKVVRFDDADVAAMQAQLARTDLTDDDRLHLEFALGKAFEDRKAPEAAFGHYARGNAVRRRALPYDPAETTAAVDAAKAVFTPEFFAARAGSGCPAPDPIFIVGMPRAGSTLLEQILSSHSQVEGTTELPDIPALTRRAPDYPADVTTWTEDRCRSVGEAYLERARVQRKTDRPFFIDKLPNNWLHVGFIKLVLPNAKIIDARRHPLSCCFSNFKQHFARGQAFTYGLEDLGKYYADYVRLMAHFDTALPGAVHRVIYERMVEDTETQIRALIAACGLPFEEACLRYYETDRAIRTPSSEQVRRPIFREGAENWQAFEPWLGPLAAALGPVLENYPDS